MTKKKQQKQQKEGHIETKDKASVANEESLDLEAQLAEAQQSAKDNWDKLLRSQAEMENLKRRTAKDLEKAHKYALDGFVKDISTTFIVLV